MAANNKKFWLLTATTKQIKRHFVQLKKKRHFFSPFPSVCMTSETTNTPTAKLRPEAPPYVPLLTKNLNSNVVVKAEPQCSRYSRRSVRRDVPPNSPRPILGTKIPFPRPILGRKDGNNNDEDKENRSESYFGKEFRSIYRRMQKLKIGEELEKQGKHRTNNKLPMSNAA